MLECTVSGAPDKIRQNCFKSNYKFEFIQGSHVGKDANWGRALCAIGYSDAEFDVSNIDLVLSSARGSIKVCEGSSNYDFNEENAVKILSEDEIKIQVFLNQGDAHATAWGCDLTYSYVKINGNYRS